jgi:hypothetical protein
MLWGMLGASIPIIIHMTNRTRAKRTPFAALDFLLLSDKRLARKLKLKQLLVLALRTLLLAAIPFALSKPYIDHPQEGTVNVASPGSVVIIIDNTLSMQALEKDESLFERGMQRAQALVERAGPQTNLAIITVARPVRVLTGDLTYDRGELQLALEKIRVMQSVGDMGLALREAERILASSELSRRQVVVISDQAKHAWKAVKTPWALKETPQAIAEDLGLETPLSNVSIVSVQVSGNPHDGAGAISAAVKLMNHSSKNRQVVVRLQLGSKDLSQTLELAAKGQTTATFSHRMEALGHVRGLAVLETSDALSADNRYYFTIDLGSTLDVLVVNGAPRDERYLDELFFLKPALHPTDDSIRTQVITSDELGSSPLDGVDVVFLANVGGLTPKQRLELRRYVEGGGGLFVAVGDQFTERSAKTYEDLLPAPIRSFKQVVRRESPSAEARALRIATVDGDHPLMADFARMRNASLFRSLVYEYVLVRGVDGDASSILARYSNGTPALMESKLGLGKILMLTTTIDRDWSDLALRSSFLPLVQSACLYLSGRLGQLNQAQGLVGERVTLRAPPGDGGLVVERPDGDALSVSMDGKGLVRFDSTSLAGHYVLKREQDSDRSVWFSVNADRSESELAKADLEVIAELLMRPGEADAPRGKIEAKPGSKAPDPFRSDLWPIVLVALFGLLLAETWVVIRGVR